MKRILVFILAFTVSITLAFSETAVIPADYYFLSLDNWIGSSHQQGGTSKIGGYIRTPNVSYDYETLSKFDMTAFQNAQVLNATIRVHITGGNVGYGSTMKLYDETNGTWDPTTVNYDTFGRTPWQELLGEVALPFAPNGWYEISTEELQTKVQTWIDNNQSNDGVILAGDFMYWGYYATIDNVELVIDYTTEPTPQEIMFRVLSCEDPADWQAASYTIASNPEAIDGNSSMTLSPLYPGELPPDNDIFMSTWIPTEGFTEPLSDNSNIELLIKTNEDIYFEFGLYSNDMNTYHHIGYLFVASGFNSWQYTSYLQISPAISQLLNQPGQFKLVMTPSIISVNVDFVLDRIYFRP